MDATLTNIERDLTMLGQDRSKEAMEELRRMLEETGSGGLLGLQMSGPLQFERPDTGYIESLFEAPTREEYRPNQFIVSDDGLRKPVDGYGLMDGAVGEDRSGGVSTQIASTEDRFNPAMPPGGDYDNYQWAGQYGWIYKGNEADGTAGKSSYINDQGQRVHYDPVNTFQRDDKYWDLKRPTIGLAEVWAKGGDIFLEDNSYRYSETNPYVYTEEMRLADEAQAAALAEQFYYDPETDTTYIGGKGSSMTMKGNPYAGKTEADYTPDEWQWLQNDRYYTGPDQFTAAGAQALRDAWGGQVFGNPYINTFDHDIDAQLELLGDKSYNPFYGDRGRTSQAVIDRQRELGHIGPELTAMEKRLDGNIMDYLYDEFDTVDQIKNRSEVLRRWNRWLSDTGFNKDALYQIRMNENIFKQMGLDEFIDYNKDYAREKREGAYDPLAGMGGMKMGKLQDLPEGLLGGPRKSFTERYLELRNKQKGPSSLIQEMKDA